MRNTKKLMALFLILGCIQILNFIPNNALTVGEEARANEEFRGMWAPRWDVNTQEEIDQLVATAKATNCNAIFPQVRGDGYSLYNSAIDPMYPSVPGGFDPLDYVITKGHAEGMEVHPWMNMLASGTDTFMDSYPANHVMKKNPQWISVDNNGNPDSVDNIFLEPGKEEVKMYLLDIINEVVTNYDVDGIHLDYIRYEGTGFGYGSDCKSAFESYYGKPWEEGGEWNDFRKGQITSLVERAYWQVKEQKDDLRFGAAVWGISNNGKNMYFQDTLYWAEMGIVDYLAPMAYYPDTELFTNSIKEYVTGSPTADIYAGIGVYKFTPSGDSAGMVNQITITRNEGCAGQMLYSMAYLRDNPSFQSALTSGPYQNLVQPPTRSPFTPVSDAQWNFSHNWLREGWKTNNMVPKYPFSGIWNASVASDPQFISPLLSLNAARSNILRIHLRNENADRTAKLYWQREGDPSFHEERSLSFQLSGNNDWQIHTIQIDQNPLWNGTIVRMRFDPVSNGDDYIELDYLRLAYWPKCLRSWLISDPFQSDSAANALDQSYLTNVTNVLPRAGEEIGGTNWHSLNSSIDLIDLTNEYPSAENCAVYAHTYVYSNHSTPRSALLKVGSDDGIKIWLNGELIHNNNILRGAEPDQDAIQCNLTPGINRLMLKVSQGGGGFGFFARLCYPDGMEMDKISLLTEAPLPSTPWLISSKQYWYGNNELSFSWDQKNNAFAGITSYDWQVKSDNITHSGTVTEKLILLPPLPDDHYVFRVSAMDELGQVSQFNSTAFGIDTAIPDAPVISPNSTLSSSGHVEWTWPQGRAGISGIKEYNYTLRSDIGTVQGNTSLGELEILLEEGIYNFSLKAIGNSGLVSEPRFSPGVTVDITPPSAPGMLALDTFAMNGSLMDANISWKEAMDNMTAVAGYEIQTASDLSNSPGELIWKKAGYTNGTQFILQLPALNSNISVRVRGEDLVGHWGAWSGILEFEMKIPSGNDTDPGGPDNGSGDGSDGNDTPVDPDGSDDGEDGMDGGDGGGGEPGDGEDVNGTGKKEKLSSGKGSSILMIILIILAVILSLAVIAVFIYAMALRKKKMEKTRDVDEDGVSQERYEQSGESEPPAVSYDDFQLYSENTMANGSDIYDGHIEQDPPANSWNYANNGTDFQNVKGTAPETDDEWDHLFDL